MRVAVGLVSAATAVGLPAVACLVGRRVGCGLRVLLGVTIPATDVGLASGSVVGLAFGSVGLWVAGGAVFVGDVGTPVASLHAANGDIIRMSAKMANADRRAIP